MKRFFKVCGITALVLIIVGFIFWGISALTVGTKTMNEVVEKLTDGKVHFENGIQIDEDAFWGLGEVLENNALYDIDDAVMFDKSYEIHKGDVEKTLLAEGGVNEWLLELGGCMFELKDSGDDCYYVAFKGAGKSQAFVEDGELHVKVLNGSEWDIVNWNMDSNDNCLTLYVPMSTTVEEVKVDLGAGQMKLDNLKVKDMVIGLGAGQVLAQNLQAEKVSISAGAGEIVLSEAQIKDVQAEVGAGNCEISGTVTGDIEADCAMGNMTFELAGSEEDFNYEIQCVTGNIIIGDRKYSGLAQEQNINNNAAKNIELECAMGNMEILFKK